MSDIIKEDSQSVQSHLSILQSIIQRMASNSASCKTFCVTLVSAILVIVADKEDPIYSFIALVPVVLFLFMDSYYLALEKSFRNTYNAFIRKLHDEKLITKDLFIMAPNGSIIKLFFKSLISFSVWIFYVTLAVMILITYLFIV